MRMRALEASQRPLSQRPRVSQRPRTQNNVYSACPRRPRGSDTAGEQAARWGRAGQVGGRGRRVGGSGAGWGRAGRPGRAWRTSRNCAARRVSQKNPASSTAACRAASSSPQGFRRSCGWGWALGPAPMSALLVLIR